MLRRELITVHSLNMFEMFDDKEHVDHFTELSTLNEDSVRRNQRQWVLTGTCILSTSSQPKGGRVVAVGVGVGVELTSHQMDGRAIVPAAGCGLQAAA